MKNLALLFCLFALGACGDKQAVLPPIVPPQVSSPQVVPVAPQLALKGTYNVTYLTQYQNGQLVFEGSLPALIGNGITIKHALSVDLPAVPSPSVASVNYGANQSYGHYSGVYGQPVTSEPTALKATKIAGTFDFYDTNGTRLGTSDGTSLSFDFSVPDSLGKPVRYVYKAVKISDMPGYFAFVN